MAAQTTVSFTCHASVAHMLIALHEFALARGADDFDDIAATSWDALVPIAELIRDAIATSDDPSKLSMDAARLLSRLGRTIETGANEIVQRS